MTNNPILYRVYFPFFRFTSKLQKPGNARLMREAIVSQMKTTNPTVLIIIRRLCAFLISYLVPNLQFNL